MSDSSDKDIFYCKFVSKRMCEKKTRQNFDNKKFVIRILVFVIFFRWESLRQKKFCDEEKNCDKKYLAIDKSYHAQVKI